MHAAALFFEPPPCRQVKDGLENVKRLVSDLRPTHLEQCGLVEAPARTTAETVTSTVPAVAGSPPVRAPSRGSAAKERRPRGRKIACGRRPVNSGFSLWAR
ncbi:hypothetical protein ACFXJ8_42600 [Nonomuraea sp. NPDC059194]|uniref:hypothetical protein n=1 Tax=Nonomuraea sp. NPDC059194 TaxID=3346764 RepID=UPI0036A42762